MALSSQAQAQLDEAVNRLMAAEDMPGLALAFTDKNGLVHQQTFGFSSLEAQWPVSAADRFEYGSIGKSFTCILLLQLAEEGQLDLHQPVSTYLPWFEVQSDFEPITPHHLMTHTAGIITGTDFPADARYEVWALRDARAANPPGTHFHYSNVGFKALGLLLQQLTGQSYASLIQQRILGPLEMEDTAPAITSASRRSLASGYTYRFDDRPWQRSHGHVPATWLETDTADGCIAGTAADLACYLRMLMNGGNAPKGRILSEGAFAALTTPHAALPETRLSPERGEEGGYGYGLACYRDGGRHFLGHGGGMVGYHTHMLADLTNGLGVAVLINGPGQCQLIAEYALDLQLADRLRKPLPELPGATSSALIENASAYAGEYSNEAETLTIDDAGDKLSFEWRGQAVALERRGVDSFLIAHPDFELFLLRFERDDLGDIVAAVHGDKCWWAGDVPSGGQRAPDEWRAYPGHYRSHNPWFGNFRVVLRNEQLILISPSGLEEPVTPRGDGTFSVGRAHSPEYVRFDTVVAGEAWRAHYSGCDYYRFFTP